MENEKELFSVESLFFIMESFIAKNDRIHLKGVLEQAKNKGIEQMKNAYLQGQQNWDSEQTFEQYYEQTFKQ